MFKFITIAALSALTTSAIAARSVGAAEAKPFNMKADITSATQKNLKGEVSFSEVPAGLHVEGKVSGLKPNSRHGFHVHEKGECKGPGYESAGNHFDPGKNEHGKPNAAVSHAGDLGNLTADSKGIAVIDRVIPNTEHAEILKMQGKAVLVHSGEDDLKTQPAGDSGDRIGCGIIRNL